MNISAEPFKTYFEVSWEIANKIGGIYTVIKTKSAVETARFSDLGDPYFLIGPLNRKCVDLEVEIVEPQFPIISETLNTLRKQGIVVSYGRWLIEGHPSVILFDIGSAYFKLNEWRQEFFELTHIGVPDSDTECKDVMVFGFLVAWFISEFTSRLPGVPTVNALFHEWQGGIGGLLLRLWHKQVAVTFHTHATLLGRYLCAGNVDFYNNLPHFDVDTEAGDRGIYHKYCLERACAATAHVFSTVSVNTGEECEHLLKRKADVICPNGLNVKEVAAQHEFQNLHNVAKYKIHTFVQSHFHGHMDFDLEDTLYIFSAGRYEYSNKGVDMFIESLAKLNHLMKESFAKKTVIAFLVFPTGTNYYNVESLRGLALLKQTREVVQSIQEKLGAKIFDSVTKGIMPNGDQILDSDDQIKLKRCILANQRTELPPIVTHNMTDDRSDTILNHLRRVKLFNQSSDKVKVIFHPEFISATSPLFNMDYEDFVRGSHLGVFPSYYEPWGYTPAECTVRGIPSVTSNVSGYGLFMADHIAEPENYGVYIVDRRNRSWWDSIEQLSNFMFKFTQMSQKQRIIQRNRCERLSELLSWTSLTKKYSLARNMAFSRAFPDIYNLPDLKEAGLIHRSPSLFFPHPYSEVGTPKGSRGCSFSSTDQDSRDDTDK
ncbi:Glycogen synthase [Oopsacas minuta]|uniref:Glycogen [starch] synthase n=1 Tax=Oopsacas minuta TaxID=111878 RepID=A0AAV7JZ76_9METZ|nr:Glycogen synthase [Oopsacas minuta]